MFFTSLKKRAKRIRSQIQRSDSHLPGRLAARRFGLWSPKPSRRVLRRWKVPVAAEVLESRTLLTPTLSFFQVTDTVFSNDLLQHDINADGNLIVFRSDAELDPNRDNSDGSRELFVYNVATDEFRQVTDTPANATNRAPSIGKTQIVYESNHDPAGFISANVDILVTDITGSSTGRLVDGDQFDTNGSATISGDDRWISFNSTLDLVGLNPLGEIELFLLDRNNGDITQITGASTPVGQRLGTFDARPRITADGSQVFFFSSANFDGTNSAGLRTLFRFNRLDGTFRQVPIPNLTGSNLIIEFDVNADGTQLVFASNGDHTGGNPDGNVEGFLIDLTTGQTTQITNTFGGGFLFRNRDFSISGDGNSIAFVANLPLTGPNFQPNLDGNAELYRYDVSTGDLDRLTDTTIGGFGFEANEAPRLNADGSQIAFLSYENYTGGNSDFSRELFLLQLGVPPPPNEPPNVAPPGGEASVNQDEPFTLTIDFTDANPGDTHSAQIDWGDGTVEAGLVDQVNNQVSGTHTYTTDGTFTVAVTVTDDSGAEGSTSFDVIVTPPPPPPNEPPNVLPPGGGLTVEQDAPLMLFIDFTDANPGDTHSAQIDWGDGTVEAGLVDQVSNQVSGMHTYTVDGTFTVTVTVTDQSGAEGGTSFDVTVTQPLPEPGPPPNPQPDPAPPGPTAPDTSEDVFPIFSLSGFSFPDAPTTFDFSLVELTVAPFINGPIRLDGVSLGSIPTSALFSVKLDAEHDSMTPNSGEETTKVEPAVAPVPVLPIEQLTERPVDTTVSHNPALDRQPVLPALDLANKVLEVTRGPVTIGSDDVPLDFSDLRLVDPIPITIVPTITAPTFVTITSTSEVPDILIDEGENFAGSQFGWWGGALVIVISAGVGYYAVRRRRKHRETDALPALPLDLDFGPLDGQDEFVITLSTTDDQPQGSPQSNRASVSQSDDGTLIYTPMPQSLRDGSETFTYTIDQDREGVIDGDTPTGPVTSGLLPLDFDFAPLDFEGTFTITVPVTEDQQTAEFDVIMAELLKLPSDFYLGLITGFFKDGLWGTVELLPFLAHLASKYSAPAIFYNDIKALIRGDFDQLTGVRAHEAISEVGEDAAAAFEVAQPYLEVLVNILRDLQNDPAPLIRAFNGDFSQLNKKLELQTETQAQLVMLMLLIASEVLPEILAGLKELQQTLADVSLEQWVTLAGRVIGFIVYTIAEAVLTAGAVEAVKAGKVAEWLAKLKNLSGIANIDKSGRIAKALERLAEIIAKFRGRIRSGMSTEEATRLTSKGLEHTARDATGAGAREMGESAARRAADTGAGDHAVSAGLPRLYDDGAQIVEEANRRNLIIVVHPEEVSAFEGFANGVQPANGLLQLDHGLVLEIKSRVALDAAGKPQRWTLEQVEFVRTHILPLLRRGDDQELLRWFAFEPSVPTERVPSIGALIREDPHWTTLPGDPEEGLFRIFSQQDLDNLRVVFAGDGPAVRTGLGPRGTVILSPDDVVPRGQPQMLVDAGIDGSRRMDPPAGFDVDAPTWAGNVPDSDWAPRPSWADDASGSGTWTGDARPPCDSQAGTWAGNAASPCDSQAGTWTGTATEQFPRILIPGSDNPLAEIPVPPRDGTSLPFTVFPANVQSPAAPPIAGSSTRSTAGAGGSGNWIQDAFAAMDETFGVKGQPPAQFPDRTLKGTVVGHGPPPPFGPGIMDDINNFPLGEGASGTGMPVIIVTPTGVRQIFLQSIRTAPAPPEPTHDYTPEEQAAFREKLLKEIQESGPLGDHDASEDLEQDRAAEDEYYSRLNSSLGGADGPSGGGGE